MCGVLIQANGKNLRYNFLTRRLREYLIFYLTSYIKFLFCLQHLSFGKLTFFAEIVVEGKVNRR